MCVLRVWRVCRVYGSKGMETQPSAHPSETIHIPLSFRPPGPHRLDMMTRMTSTTQREIRDNAAVHTHIKRVNTQTHRHMHTHNTNADIQTQQIQHKYTDKPSRQTSASNHRSSQRLLSVTHTHIHVTLSMCPKCHCVRRGRLYMCGVYVRVCKCCTSVM